MRTGIFVALLFLISLSSRAQAVAVRASVDKNKILLGEPLWLVLEVKTLNNVVPPSFKVDSISHFEFIVKDSTGTLHSGDTTIYRQYFQLTSFDSGRWVIPPFTLRPFVKTESVLVDVAFRENFDPKKPYHDVQPLRNVPYNIGAALEKWWHLIAALLIALILFIYWLTRKKNRKPEPGGPALSAFKKAMLELSKLKKECTADEKLFYAQLIDIFRTYVHERVGVTSRQQTSDHLVEKLQPLFKDRAAYDRLSKVLFLCDFVKFAKYHPQKAEANSAYEIIEKSIQYVEEGLNQSIKKR